MFLIHVLAFSALCLLGLLVSAFGARLARFASAVAMLALSALPAAAAPLDAFITAATPSIIELLGAFLTAAIALAARTARQKWGIEIEAKHREALQSAILTGARLAIAGKLDTAAAIQLILQHVSVSVPDAVTALQPSAEVLENLARAKLQEAAQIVGTDKLTDAMRKALAG